jgi:methyl-accepting chemotaxis protein
MTEGVIFMESLLENYSISDILIFLVILAIAFKGVVSFGDWFKERMTKWFSKDLQEENQKQSLNQQFSELNNKLEDLLEKEESTCNSLNALSTQVKSLNSKVDKKHDELNRKIESLNERIDANNKKIEGVEAQTKQMSEDLALLKASDKDAIKAFLSDKHEEFVNKGWIDDYNMDICENRYNHYKAYHGNSFIEGFMNDIRELPNKEKK